MHALFWYQYNIIIAKHDCFYAKRLNKYSSAWFCAFILAHNILDIYSILMAQFHIWLNIVGNFSVCVAARTRPIPPTWLRWAEPLMTSADVWLQPPKPPPPPLPLASSWQIKWYRRNRTPAGRQIHAPSPSHYLVPRQFWWLLYSGLTLTVLTDLSCGQHKVV